MWFGYSFTFKTNKAMNKMIKLGHIDKNSNQYKLFLSSTNVKSARISGVVLLFFAFLLFFMSIYRIISIFRVM